MIKLTSKPEPGFQVEYFNYFSNTKMIQPDRYVTVEEFHQQLTSEDFAKQCEKCHASYDNLHDALSDCNSSSSEVPLYESSIRSTLENIARLDGSRDDVMAQCDELQSMPGDTNKALRVRNSASNTHTMCQCLPRMYPSGEYADSGQTTASRDVQMYVAAEWFPAGSIRCECTTYSVGNIEPTLTCSLGGSNGRLALYEIHFSDLTVDTWSQVTKALQERLSTSNFPVTVQQKISSSYPFWSDPTARYNAQAPVIEADELIGASSAEVLGPEEPNGDGAYQGSGAASLCLNEFDIEELTTHHEPSEADFVTKDYLERGWLAPYPFFEEIVSAADNNLFADVMTDSCLVALSAILTNVTFEDINTGCTLHYLNLSWIFVGARASRKSLAMLSKPLTELINEKWTSETREKQRQYKKQMVEYRRAAGKNSAEIPEYPEEPSNLGYFVFSANTTGAAFLSETCATNGEGIIFCDEIDELANSKNGRFNDSYLVMLRKNAVNEEIASDRTGTGQKRCKYPHVAMCAAAQPERLRAFLGDGADGYFSRFMFTCIPHNRNFEADFGEDPNKRRVVKSVRDVIESYTQHFTEIYNALHNRKKPIKCVFPYTVNAELKNFMQELKKAFSAQIDFYDGNINRAYFAIWRMSAIFALTRPRDIEWYATAETLEVSVEDVRLAVHHYMHRIPAMMQVVHRCYQDMLNGGGRFSVPASDEKILGKFNDELTYEELCEIIRGENPDLSNDAVRKRASRKMEDLCKKGLIIPIVRGRYRKVVQ